MLAVAETEDPAIVTGRKRGRRPGPRIRSFKPELFQHEKVGRLTDKGRVLMFGLISMADDEGRFRCLSPSVIGHVFPYDQITHGRLGKLLGELEREQIILRYVVEGVPYGAFRNWRRHQRIEKPTASEIPAPPDADVVERNSIDYDGDSDEISGKSSGNNRGKVDPPLRGRAHPDPDPDPDPAVDASRDDDDRRAREREPDPVEVVWERYLAARGDRAGGKPSLNDTRRRVIRKALRVRPMETVLAAVDGLFRSAWHMGDNPGGKRYDDIRYALSGNSTRGESAEERIDSMAAPAPVPGAAPGGAAPTFSQYDRPHTPEGAT